MASKADQSLKIALIIFVLLLVLACVAAYMIYGEWEKAYARATDSEKKAQQSDQERAKLDGELRDLKVLLGVGPDEATAQVKETHKKDMEAYGQALLDAQLPPAQFAEGELHYRRWVEYLFDELRSKMSRIDKNAQDEKQLNKKVTDDDAANAKEVAIHKEENAKTAAELADERNKFKTARGEFEGLASGLERKLKDRLTESDDAAKQATADAEALRKRIAELVATNDGLRKRITTGEQSQAQADGEVTWVNQRDRTVWLNVGKDDGLRQQISFKVVSLTETNPASAKGKGKIEVVKVGPRQSEARIVDDTNADPIMPGDLIFSAAFERGTKERFVLMGKIDIDGDGTGDRKRVRELIELNGGVIDAELTEDGRMEGQVTVNTRYLVLGDPPTDEAALKRFTKIIDDVNRYGVERLSTKEFLDRIGYQAGVRAKSLSRGAKASDFPAKLEGGVQRKSPAAKLGDFKPRSPKDADAPKGDKTKAAADAGN